MDLFSDSCRAEFSRKRETPRQCVTGGGTAFQSRRLSLLLPVSWSRVSPKEAPLILRIDYSYLEQSSAFANHTKEIEALCLNATSLPPFF